MINSDELLFSVDDDNNPIDPQPCAISHRTGIWHRSCHVWIINADRQILCQQRSLLKDSNPGLWEPFFGGHLAPRQEYAEAAQNEVEEELGLQIEPGQLHFYEEYKHEKGTEFQGIFTVEWSGNIASLQLEADEVEKVEWRSVDDIERLVVREKSDLWTRMGYEQRLLDWLKDRI